MKKYAMMGEMVKVCAMAAVITFALPEVGFAETLGEIMDATASDQVKPFATLLSALCYVGGAISMAAGAISLRKHADNPSSEPAAKGITRLVVGGAIMSLPYLGAVMQETIFGEDATDATYSDFTGFSTVSE